MEKTLIGNSFPLSLIRRRVVITPCGLEELQQLLAEREIVSFWGHRNTLEAVKQCLGYDLTPHVDRPALTLSAAGLPVYEGEVFGECWVLSPDYRDSFRPAIGIEVTPEQILGWQCLLLTF